MASQFTAPAGYRRVPMLNFPVPPVARAVVATLLSLWLGSSPLCAAAQAQDPPAQAQSGLAGTRTSGAITLRDGRQIRGIILLYIPDQKVVIEREGNTEVYPAAELSAVALDPSAIATVCPAAPQPTIVTADPFRQQELARLYAQLERLRSSNRHWQPPALGLGLGVAAIITGGVVFALAWGPSGGEDYNVRMDRTGLTLMPIGAALILINMPMLIVRAAREARMQRTEATMRRLGGQVSLTPLWSPRGEAGFGVHARF